MKHITNGKELVKETFLLVHHLNRLQEFTIYGKGILLSIGLLLFLREFIKAFLELILPIETAGVDEIAEHLRCRLLRVDIQEIDYLVILIPFC